MGECWDTKQSEILSENNVLTAWTVKIKTKPNKMR